LTVTLPTAGIYKITFNGSYYTDVTSTGCRIYWGGTGNTTYNHGYWSGSITNAVAATEQKIPIINNNRGTTLVTTAVNATGVTQTQFLTSELITKTIDANDTFTIFFGSEVNGSPAYLRHGLIIATKIN
jgi:hypothetical protein